MPARRLRPALEHLCERWNLRMVIVLCALTLRPPGRAEGQLFRLAASGRGRSDIVRDDLDPAIAEEHGPVARPSPDFDDREASCFDRSQRVLIRDRIGHQMAGWVPGRVSEHGEAWPADRVCAARAKVPCGGQVVVLLAAACAQPQVALDASDAAARADCQFAVRAGPAFLAGRHVADCAVFAQRFPRVHHMHDRKLLPLDRRPRAQLGALEKQRLHQPVAVSEGQDNEAHGRGRRGEQRTRAANTGAEIQRGGDLLDQHEFEDLEQLVRPPAVAAALASCRAESTEL